MCDVNKSVISLTEHHCQDVMREKGAGLGGGGEGEGVVGKYSIMGTIPPGFFKIKNCLRVIQLSLSLINFI